MMWKQTLRTTVFVLGLIVLLLFVRFVQNRVRIDCRINKTNKTITWKIGDANKTVRGLNYYKIVYEVKNAVRFGNPDFDELYWNLLGTFWQIDIDNFSAELVFHQKSINRMSK